MAFGRALDQDDFKAAEALLHPNCTYDIGKEVLEGAQAICNSYEQNMIEGRKKLDELEWGQCRVEAAGTDEVDLFFTDYLGHAGLKHTFRCKQRLRFDEAHRIVHITHMNLDGEPEKLDEFYRKVGLR